MGNKPVVALTHEHCCSMAQENKKPDHLVTPMRRREGIFSHLLKLQHAIPEGDNVWGNGISLRTNIRFRVTPVVPCAASPGIVPLCLLLTMLSVEGSNTMAVRCIPDHQRSFFRKRAKWSVFISTMTSPTLGTLAHTDSRTCSAS